MGFLRKLLGGAAGQEPKLGDLMGGLDYTPWTTTITDSATTSCANTITIAASSLYAVEPEPKREETALEWLDRRVEEMCVQL